MLFLESSLNRRPSMLLILDHVLTTTSNNRPHLTTFFGDSFDGFNKSGNQLGFKPLIASNKHTIIPARHQHLSSRPRHEKRPVVRSFFMPNYLIYWGPNPPDPLGRFAPKSGRSPNLATCTIQKKLLEELLDLISRIRTFVKTM